MRALLGSVVVFSAGWVALGVTARRAGDVMTSSSTLARRGS
jgi:hypothetical protein